MSLRVDDPRSRGRSKSPGGRIRERSTSRDNRLPSQAPGNVGRTYFGSDAVEISRSKSRDARPGSRYDYSGSESGGSGGRYARSERRHDGSYNSDSGDGKTAKRNDKKSYDRSPSLRPVKKYDSYSDDSYSDSGDEALAYGEIPSGVERGLYKESPRTSSSRVDGPARSGALNGGQYAQKDSSRPRNGSDEDVSGRHPSYGRPSAFQYSTPTQYLPNQPSSGGYPGYPPTSSASQLNWAPIPESEKPGFVPPTSQGEGQSMPGAFPTPVSAAPTATVFSTPQYVDPGKRNPYVPRNAYVPPVSSPTHQRNFSSDAAIPPTYANPAQFQYAHVDPNVKYTPKNTAVPYKYSTNPQFSKQGAAHASEPQYSDIKYSANPQFSNAPPTTRQESEPRYVEITPGHRTTGRPSGLSISSANNLSVAGPDPDFRPASPLLEPYKGTYQSISPMPSPIAMPSGLEDEMSDLELLDGSSDTDERSKLTRKKSKNGKDRKESRSDHLKGESSRGLYEEHDSHERAVVMIAPPSARKRVTFYDPSHDALAMQEALSHTRNIDNKSLIRVLPHLTSEEILDLRKEYKNHVKLHGKGINMAKHIRLKLGNSTFGKVCYATALGRWESEAFWANCYYQSSTSRRELLIESLIGRSNSEIREIKECFRDSRYLDSLEKCMKAELKADKFRVAVLLALEETRQSERDPIDVDLVQRDVDELHRALISRHGGETAMIYIIVRRSDSHLREVLHAYEKIYKENFARAMIAKSQNLVGETLAHILNGAINRPMRDALLLHQALRESRTGKERSELLISRLVRLHWEPRHFEQVKIEFRRRYQQRLEEAIAEEVLVTNGGSEWGEFCIELARSSKTLSGRG